MRIVHLVTPILNNLQQIVIELTTTSKKLKLIKISLTYIFLSLKIKMRLNYHRAAINFHTFYFHELILLSLQHCSYFSPTTVS